MLLDDDRHVFIGRCIDPPEEPEHPSLDYALIEIDPCFRDFRLMPLDSHLDSPHLHPLEVATRPRDSHVLSVTGSAGLLKGTMSGTPSYKTIPGSKRIQELWTVRFEGKLVTGDCGSWVVNAQSGDLFGHIIAGSPESGVGYIVPAYQILEDVKTRFGLDLELYTPTESTTTKESSLVQNSYVPELLPTLSGNEPESKDGALPIQKETITTINPFKSVTPAEDNELTALNSIAEDSPSRRHCVGDFGKEAETQESDHHSIANAESQKNPPIVNSASDSVDQNNHNDNNGVPYRNRSTLRTVNGGGFYMAYLDCTSSPAPTHLSN